MPDFILKDHLLYKLGLSPMDLLKFENKGIIRGVEKGGRIFYSSQEFYKLKGVLYFMRKKGLSLDEARTRIDLAVVR